MIYTIYRQLNVIIASLFLPLVVFFFFFCFVVALSDQPYPYRRFLRFTEVPVAIQNTMEYDFDKISNNMESSISHVFLRIFPLSKIHPAVEYPFEIFVQFWSPLDKGTNNGLVRRHCLTLLCLSVLFRSIILLIPLSFFAEGTGSQLRYRTTVNLEQFNKGPMGYPFRLIRITGD